MCNRKTMKHLTSRLSHFNLHNKCVLLRADLNVPLIENQIADDLRLRAIQPTLDYLLKKKAIIFVATHLGRPNGKYDPYLSTKILLPWFKKNNYSVDFEPDLKVAATRQYQPGSIILLENMRFFPGEQNHDPRFAQELAACAEYYVNDAFGALHRNDTSLTLVADSFSSEKKTVGFLVSQELNELEKLKNPQQPFILIMGGGKVDTKLLLIKNMLNYAQAILLCPAIVFTFLQAQGKPVGKSLVNEALIAPAQEILTASLQKKCSFFFPLDYQIADSSWKGPLSIVAADAFPSYGFGISIGPKTLLAWTPIIHQAKTIFFNAAMGFAQRPKTVDGTNSLLQSIAQSNAYTVIGGGDSAAAVARLGLTEKFDFISTGGGATLAYLSNQPLPGLDHIS